MASRVLLHIGLPKTGTTWLQHLLWENRPVLRADGHHLVVDSMSELYAAARDLRRGGEHEWTTLVEAIAATPGTAVVSCEGLSAVPADAADAGLSALDGADIRVVCTLRDPARMLASAWQQHVRTGSTLSMTEFVGLARGGTYVEWFPNPLEVLDAWSGDGKIDVRLVTVPPPGAPAALLWERFADACDLDQGLVDPFVKVENASLELEHVELLRRVNVALGDRKPDEVGRYRELVRPLVRPRARQRVDHSLSDPTLTPSRVVALEASDHEWMLGTAHELVSALKAQQWPVSGDLDDLLPPARPAAPPDDLEAAIARAAAELTADLLLNLKSTRRAEQGGGQPAARGRRRRDRADSADRGTEPA